MIEFLIWGFIIYSCVQLLRVFTHISALGEAEQKIKAHLDTIIHNVTVEEVNSVQYWYDKDNNEFLGQGKTVEDVVVHLKSRFPDHIFLVENKGILHGPEWTFAEKFDFVARKRHYGIE